MAVLDPSIHEQMVTRWAEFSPLSIVLRGPIMEEIIFRLGVLSAVAWVTARFTGDRWKIFYLAVGVSALAFGIAHVFYGGVTTPTYQAGMAVKGSAAGPLLGGIFWRWGLPYSITCHCTANGGHLPLMLFLFQGQRSDRVAQACKPEPQWQRYVGGSSQSHYIHVNQRIHD